MMGSAVPDHQDEDHQPDQRDHAAHHGDPAALHVPGVDLIIERVAEQLSRTGSLGRGRPGRLPLGLAEPGSGTSAAASAAAASASAIEAMARCWSRMIRTSSTSETTKRVSDTVSHGLLKSFRCLARTSPAISTPSEMIENSRVVRYRYLTRTRLRFLI